MNGFPDSVVDDDGNVHHLVGEPLGRGGQGVVLRTSNPHIAVKLIGNAPVVQREPKPRNAGNAAARLWTGLTQATAPELTHDKSRHEALRRRIEDVRLLPLPDLHVAQPLSMLRGHVGYTMNLLTGMVPIRSLIADPRAKSLSAFYKDTGGVRRRLDLLAKTASLLSRLHAVPLVYADISPNNVFISEALDASEVWLIDLDNLDYLSSEAPGIYTPGFGAPEVASGHAGVTTLSDSYSFAILAFYVLAQTHPFLGKFVDEAGWDADEDREQLAYQGQAPWIDDPDDDSNGSESGIPRQIVLSRRLRMAFQRTFGPGRIHRTERPSTAEWAEVLRETADRMVTCPGCGSSFDVTMQVCGFCPAKRRPAFIHMQINRWDPEAGEQESEAVGVEPVWNKMLDLAGDTVVHRHVVRPTIASADDLPVMTVRRAERGVSIEPMAGAEIHAVVDGQLHEIDRPRTLPLPSEGHEIYLHFGPLDMPHRIAALRYYPGDK